MVPVAYAENFNRGVRWVAHGGHLHLECAVCDVTIWRHTYVSKPTFWRSLLTQYAYSSTRNLLISYVIARNISYQLLKLGYQRKRHSTLWRTSSYLQKVSGCALKQGCKTHSSLRQSNLQLQNEAARMSRQIRAVERRCAAGQAGAHPRLQDRIFLNYTHELRMRI